MLIMPRIVKVQGLVLQAVPWREKDRLLTVLTKERGKLSVLAQGAMRPQNRLTPSSQTGVQGNFWLAKARDLDRVTDVRIEKMPLRLRTDIAALSAFGIMAEILELSAPAEAPDEELFAEVLWFHEQLEGGAPTHKWLVAMLIRLLMHLGWAPYLVTCAVCGNGLTDDPVAFAPSFGGSLCKRCASLKAPPDANPCPSAVLQTFHALLRQPKLIFTLQLRPTFWGQALALMRAYWRYHLEAEVRAWQVWAKVPPAALTAVILP